MRKGTSRTRIAFILSLLVVLASASALAANADDDLPPEPSAPSSTSSTTTPSTGNCQTKVGVAQVMGILNYWVSDEEMAMCSDEGVALWNRKGDNINVVGARVGIGTTDPRADLHVRGTILADRFIKTDGTAISSGSSVWQESNGNAFRDSGKVGIGTQDPQARLHIEGGNLLVGPKPDQSVSTINAIGNGSLQNNGVVRSNRGLMIRKQSAANPLQGFVFISGGDNGQTGTLTMYNGATAPAIAVKVMATGNSFFNGGNVGIGTNTPQAKLDLLGSGDTENIVKIKQGGSGTQNAVLLDIQNNQGNSILRVISNRNIFADGTLIAASTGYGPSLIVERGSNSRDEDNLVEFQSNQFVVIKKSGLMGVGTREPTARLHVAGTLKVEGDIQADSYSGLKNSISMITARATVVDTAKRTVNTDTACPTGTSITVYGTLEEIQFWNGGMSHWYAKCQKQGNGIRASLYTDKGYAGHYLTCFGMCVRD